jgi:uncharacterized protein YjbI with pentapeptide repeats
MADQQHLDLLKQGVDAWNTWRKEHPNIKIDLYRAHLNGFDLSRIDLTGANLSGAHFNRVHFIGANLSEANLSKTNLREADFRGANLRGANLRGANLRGANLRGADLSGANLNNAYLGKSNHRGKILIGADLNRANLSGANLREANLREVNLSEANLSRAYLDMGTNLGGANLREANLSEANLSWTYLEWANISGANLSGAHLTGCFIYAVSAWNVQLDGTIQSSLIITPYGEPMITVDNLEVAQFIYLLLNNNKIRDVIDTITSKVVLILGRFTDERKEVLHALRDELRKRNYSPVLFDFEKPSSRDFTETVRTLAHISRFIIADITHPSSAPQELQAIVPELEVPVQPLLQEGNNEYSMFPDFNKYSWVFPTYIYKDQASLIAQLKEKIINPAEKRVEEIAIERAKRLERQ